MDLGALRARVSLVGATWLAQVRAAPAAVRGYARAPPVAPLTRLAVAQILAQLLASSVNWGHAAVLALGGTLTAWAVLLLLVGVPLSALLQTWLWLGALAALVAWTTLLPPTTAVAVAREWAALTAAAVTPAGQG